MELDIDTHRVIGIWHTGRAPGDRKQQHHAAGQNRHLLRHLFQGLIWCRWLRSRD